MWPAMMRLYRRPFLSLRIFHFLKPTLGCNHSRPQSRLALVAAGDWARGPSGSLGPCTQSPAAKRAKRLWGQEWAVIRSLSFTASLSFKTALSRPYC